MRRRPFRSGRRLTIAPYSGMLGIASRTLAKMSGPAPKVFCNRAFRISTPLFVGDAISLFQKTRSANAFNWGALNVGNGIHTLVVKAQLDASVTGVGTFAQAAVGKRTLVVEPAKLANDAAF